jgi:hypothetical protein
MTRKAIPAYVVNLKKRTERKENILQEFAGRDEFEVHIVEAIEHATGATGLWLTILDILQHRVDPAAEFILLCEDDHQFTEHYTREILWDCIGEALERDADVLSGGVSWFDDCFQASGHLFWIRKFSGLQFTILFRRCFDTLLQTGFGPKDVADYKIAAITQNKFVVYPFFSTQRDYGYSDATPHNNIDGKVEKYFLKSNEHFQWLREVSAFYKDPSEEGPTAYEYERITLPVYVINPLRQDLVRQQFAGKGEFEVFIEEAPAHEVEELRRWMGIRQAVQKAIDADDDVILICDDTHVFSPDYSRDYLLKNIIEAHEQGAGILLGGVATFGHAVPVTKNRFWINSYWRAPLVVLYKKIFSLLMEEPFDEKILPDEALSDLTSNKMALFPFVSIDDDFLRAAGRLEELEHSFLQQAPHRRQ